MTEYAIVPATREHALELARTMRAADVEELAALGRDPKTCLLESLAGLGESYAGLVDGKVACIFGVAPRTLISQEGYPWLLASDLMVKHAKVFLRLNRPYVAHIFQAFNHLHNFVSTRNTAAIRWLRWLGFTVADEDTILKGGATVRYFEKRNV